MNRTTHYLFLGIFCTTLIGLQVNSSAWFRLKLADSYKSKGEYIKAIQIYNKVLRKNGLKKHLTENIFSTTNFSLGYLYAKLDLRNLAIESYAKANAGFKNAGRGPYYLRNNLEKDKLIAIGLLEGGRWEEAVEEFIRLKRLYPQFQDVDKYIDTAVDLRQQPLALKDRELLFKAGDAYIKNGLFEEAQAYFSRRILDYGLDHLEVLGYLQKKYAKDRYIKNKVWGKDIYVSLEDFESLEPRLSRWGLLEQGVNNHCISKENAYKGNRSEFLDISYYNLQGHDSWEKIINIPLSDTDLNLGLRFFIKKVNPSVNILLCIETTYPKQGASGISGASIKGDIIGGWQEQRMEPLFAKAEGMAKADRNNWDTEGMWIDKLIVLVEADSDDGSNKFYIDEVELYLL